MNNRNVHLKRMNRIENHHMRKTGLKSVMGSALFISLILHLFFFAMIFYYIMQNEPVSAVQVGIEAQLISVVKPANKLKPPPLKVVQRFHNGSRGTATKISVAKPDSLTPEIEIRPDNRPNRPINSTKPRLKQSAVAPAETAVALSTTSRALRELNPELLRMEASSNVEIGSFGLQRRGNRGVKGAEPPPREPGAPKMRVDTGHGAKDDGFAASDKPELKKNTPSYQPPFSSLMQKLAHQVVNTSDANPVDVVFVIDASGSMNDNIQAVAENLEKMVDIYEASDIDYALGLTEFRTNGAGRNVIKVLQLTKDFRAYRRTLQNIWGQGDENALDAVIQTVKEIRFRPTSKKHFILVTDEPFTSFEERVTVTDVIAYCREFDISVNVLGLPIGPVPGQPLAMNQKGEHQALAKETGGKWFRIPTNFRSTSVPTPKTTAATLRNADWYPVAELGNPISHYRNDMPIDIVLFIDGSESMKGKFREFLNKFTIVIQDWNRNAVDYQIGAVNFRTRASVSMVTVFNPPQTLEQLQKIAALPCREDEKLLDAIDEGLRRIKLRPNAKRYFILITDEPAKGKYSSAAIIELLQRNRTIVSVVGIYDGFQNEIAYKTGGIWVSMPDGYTRDASSR